MNTRSFFTLITAATAVTALAAGMLLAISAPAPAAEDFGQAVLDLQLQQVGTYKLAVLNSGLSKQALRDQREFEAQVAALKHRQHAEADQPIVSLRPKRRALALVALVLWALAILSLILGSC